MSDLNVEDIKRASNGLRGTLRESLADPVTGALREADQVILKFHGSYQQDDRDLREERRIARLEPAFSFMVRTRTPGGVLSAAQWLALDAIASRYAERGLRLTTRQAVQLHGVIKWELKATLAAINAALIDTFAACGDVNRNISVAANPEHSALHAEVYAQAAALSQALLPNTRAYYEIWLDEECVAGGEPVAEPLYGPTYLPRKFKIAFAIPPYNDVDVYAQDLGFVAEARAGAVSSYVVLVGGGMGSTHGDASTYPRLAEVLGRIDADAVLPVATAVLTAQRDLGERGVRKHARLKYTLERVGLEAFKREVEARSGVRLAAAPAPVFLHHGDRYGWVEGAQGRGHLTLRILSGRIVDSAQGALQSGLRALAQTLLEAGEGQFRITPNQNLMLTGISAALRPRIDALVREYGLDLHARASPLTLNALACVALPTCALAMAEAERYLPRLLERVQARLEHHGLGAANINLRISGCPNGCSRPYLGEIALVGKGPGRYNLMLGADHRGSRLNRLYRENLDEAQLLEALDPLFADYGAAREPGEGFGDFLVRRGVVHPPAVGSGERGA